MSEQRFEKAQFAAWLGIIGNIALAVMKGIVGWLSGSKALLADAANSASDVAGSVAVLLGLKAAKRPPDEDHPYGHGKAESISAIIVSVLLLLVGLEIGLNSIKTIYGGVGAAPKEFALIAIGISIVVKECLFQYSFRLGKKLSSQALIATAWDHRTDVMSSVAVLVGVGGAVLGDYTNQPMLYYLDPAAGLFVAFLVLRMGIKLVTESIHTTMDHVLHSEETEELLETAQRVKGVIAVNELRAREHGHYVIVDIKISVNPKITVHEGHDIGKAVKHQLLTKFSHVSDVFIHVNPYDPGYPYKDVDSEHPDFPTLLH
ncbi:cation diffusion facilitator family transporter [Paenibacillus flagellatus]|uniref:Cation-efflux pump n=1 Tax=Paenibacillus flagellatus TaxID=2211139 RepID=A0A2V5K2F3_9BACL|nr:cation diffusion facilitator family transporter [Paenibacillus flagellatus]PYI53321.1 cation-efflux pump [Paenibacillus flagellatus]